MYLSTWSTAVVPEKVVELLGLGALLEGAGRWTWRCYSPAPLPIHSVLLNCRQVDQLPPASASVPLPLQ